ncbi:MAG: putative ABC transporter permease [Clostridia bacterium]|nr:putative ABC transporter permease [Clostridia bacterium]
MHHFGIFHLSSWLVYFYFYSICGWIFESGNVSIREHKWVNRGFMKGPWLPLYGSGAVVILIVTMPFADNPIAVYFAGAIGATILEYITGVAMLELFKVRYWDYRYRKIQFQGQICLVSTIAWGFLSLLMVYGIHPWVERLVGDINVEVVNVATFVITLLITYDFTNALRDALDLRKLIIQANELKEKLEAKIEESKEEIEDKLEEAISQLRYGLSELREDIELRSRKVFLRNPSASMKGLEEESKLLKAKLYKRFEEMQKEGYGTKSAK